MMTVAQYLIYFLVGALFFSIVMALLSVATGVTFLAQMIMFLPLFLAGYASGLSFFYPRVAAIVSIILVLPFIVFGVYYILPVVVGLAVMVILVSVFALLRSKTSLWSHQKESFGKVTIGIFAALPALLATLILLMRIKG